MLWNWNTPFAEMENLRRRMDVLFDQTRHYDAGASSHFPPVNIYNHAQAVQVVAELPGVDREQLDISFVDGVLTLKGERRAAFNAAQDQGAYLRQERRMGRFEKTIQIPMEIDADGIQASLKEGVLVLDLPKADRARTRQILVN